MSSPFADSGFNPFLSANQFIANRYKQGLRDQRSAMRNRALHDALTLHQVHTEGTLDRTKPTPENTGAPVPGYRKRGPINPSTTGAPVPGTLSNNTSIHPITGASVPPVPIKRSKFKQTAPGTKPKQR